MVEFNLPLIAAIIGIIASIWKFANSISKFATSVDNLKTSMQESKDDRIDLRKGFNEHAIAITEIRSDARETREDIVDTNCAVIIVYII